MASFLSELQHRGFIHQCTDPAALEALTAEQTVAAYVGYDLTADSLHVGSLVSIMMLRWLQHHGHKPIVLLGGGTTRIGDPTGRSQARPLLEAAELARNRSGIERVFSRFLHFGDGPQDAAMVDNAIWLDSLSYIDFMRDIGGHFSVSRMLTAESVRQRLSTEQPLSFLEFSYPVVQAYDFVQLNRTHGCRLQMGGSDQWGNIVAGIELSRRLGGPPLFGLTSPLITTASGKKMSKTASGTLWLNEERVSPYAYWQFWRNTEDADVRRFLSLFTDLPMGEITRLCQAKGAELNEAKRMLATQATALLHGREAAQEAADTARDTFERGDFSAALPEHACKLTELQRGIGVLALCVDAGLAQSNSEARRLIANRGLKINSTTITDPRMVIGTAQIRANGFLVLSRGKKDHVRVIADPSP